MEFYPKSVKFGFSDTVNTGTVNTDTVNPGTANTSPDRTLLMRRLVELC